MHESTPQLLSTILLWIILFARFTFGMVYNFIETFSNSTLIPKNPNCLSLSAGQLIKYEYILLFLGTLIALLYYIFALYSVYRSFGTVTMTVIGIEQQLVKYYRNYQFFTSFLVVDSVFVMITCIVIIWYGNVGLFVIPKQSYLGIWDYVFLSLFGIIPIFSLPFIIIFTRSEITWILIIWIILSLLWPVYLIVYSSVVFAVQNPYNHGENFGTIRKVITILLSFTTIIWRLLTLIICIVNMCGFGNGLYQKFYPTKALNYNPLPQKDFVDTNVEREGFD